MTAADREFFADPYRVCRANLRPGMTRAEVFGHARAALAAYRRMPDVCRRDGRYLRIVRAIYRVAAGASS